MQTISAVLLLFFHRVDAKAPVFKEVTLGWPVFPVYSIVLFFTFDAQDPFQVAQRLIILALTMDTFAFTTYMRLTKALLHGKNVS